LSSSCEFVVDVDTGQTFCYFPVPEIFFLLMFPDPSITDSILALVFTLFLGPGVNAACGD